MSAIKEIHEENVKKTTMAVVNFAENDLMELQADARLF